MKDKIFRQYIIDDLRKYNEKLNIATKGNDEKEIYLFMGVKIELEQLLKKHDKLYKKGKKVC